jgi:hypothetical protein
MLISLCVVVIVRDTMQLRDAHLAISEYCDARDVTVMRMELHFLTKSQDRYLEILQSHSML